MLTVTILLSLAALVLGIIALAGKWAHAVPAAIVLLALVELLERIPK